MRATLLLLLIAMSAPLAAQTGPDPAAELLRLHGELLEAHRQGDLDRWMALESARYVSANGGRVTFPAVEDRREGRANYLERATFEIYRDVREPLVRVSEDGTLGWLIAEVQVRGYLSSPSGEPEPFHDVWAWVELYENVEGGWRLVGNASNRRPGTDDGVDPEPPGADSPDPEPPRD